METIEMGVNTDNESKRAQIVDQIRAGQKLDVIARQYNMMPVHVHNIWKAELRRVAVKDINQEIRADVRKQHTSSEPELTNRRKIMMRANAFYEGGESARAVCARLGISYNSFHAWRYDERKQGRLPQTNMRPATPRSHKKKGHTETIYSSQHACRMCEWLENELRRVEAENLNLRIANKKIA